MKKESKVPMNIKERKKITIEMESSTLWKGLAVILGILFLISIATGGFGSSAKSAGTVAKNQIPTAAPSPSQAPQPEYIEVSEDDDPFMGDPKAPVTMIEFSDYQCPFCGRFYSQTLPTIRQKYIETGKVKFVYRDLPLEAIGHTEAEEAAMTANCAGEQGKYFDMHDKIFENVALWAKNPGYEDIFLGFANDLGLDEAEFKSCYSNPETRKEVQDDYAEAGRLGATGTPTFFINGRRVVGAQPTQVFEGIIEEELAKS